MIDKSESEMNILPLYGHPKYCDQTELFISKYDLVEAVMLGDNRFSKASLKPIKERICRFCTKPYPETKFSNYSHLFPQSLGFQNLFSDFECDECNHKFGANESDLVNFIGISRSIAALNQEGLGPTFKGKLVSARSKIYANENIVVLSVDELPSDEISIQERKAGILRIPYTKQPYIPLKVYKALLKSALSMISEEEIRNHYSNAIRFLRGEFIVTEGCILSWFNMPIPVDHLPVAYLFKKRNSSDNLHTHIVSCYFQNHIINIPIPLHNLDMPTAKGNFQLLFTPPFFATHELENIEVLPGRKDMSSDKKVSDDIEVLTIAKDKSSNEKAVKYDPVTDTITETNDEPESTRRIIFSKDGFSVNPKEFSAYIRREFGD